MFDKIYQFPSGTSLLTERRQGDQVSIDGKLYSLKDFQIYSDPIDTKNQRVVIESASMRKHFWITQVKGKQVIAWPGGCVELETQEAGENSAGAGGKAKPLKLTMPGKVLSIKVREGELVMPGQALVVVEAMKMENLLTASAAAKIAKIHVKEGDRLESGALLVSFEA